MPTGEKPTGEIDREAKRIECTSWRIARKVLRDFPIPPASQVDGLAVASREFKDNSP